MSEPQGPSCWEGLQIHIYISITVNGIADLFSIVLQIYVDAVI